MIDKRSRETYGSPRIFAELRDDGLRVGRRRVERLMRAAGLQGASRREGVRTTKRRPEARPALALVERTFTADGPDELWGADITDIPTWAGFLYLAVVMDAWSRRIVGCKTANHLRTELVLEALNLALWQRRPEAVIHHSDQGTQCTSIAFGLRCKEVGVRPSMGSVGDCFDNAMCESFFATLERELLDKKRFPTHAEARMAVFEFIDGWPTGDTQDLVRSRRSTMRSNARRQPEAESAKPSAVAGKLHNLAVLAMRLLSRYEAPRGSVYDRHRSRRERNPRALRLHAPCGRRTRKSSMERRSG